MQTRDFTLDLGVLKQRLTGARSLTRRGNV